MAVYKEKDKKIYLKYYRNLRGKGRLPQTFGRWLGAKRSTSRTKGVSSKLRRSGLTEADIKRLRGK